MLGKAGRGGLTQQAKKMQENMKKAQAELAVTEVNGEAGNGLVKVVMTCNHEVKSISISPDLIAEAAEDKEMLEDLVLAAVNQGLPGCIGDFFKEFSDGLHAARRQKGRLKLFRRPFL